MNKIFKVIWNHTTQRFDVVSELTRSKGKSSSQTDKRISLVKNAVALATIGGAVIGGQAYAATSVDTAAGVIEAWGGNVNDAHSSIAASMALGKEAFVENSNSVAIGDNARIELLPVGTLPQHGKDSPGSNSVALGSNAKVRGQQGVAIGNSAEAVMLSTATGQNAKAVGYASVATGQNSKASDQWSTATGVQSKASAAYANALGGQANASSWGSTALGTKTIVNGDEGTAVGYEADVTGRDGTASGAQSLAAEKATATGAQAKAEGTRATASGFKSNASGANSVASGVNSTANASGAIAIGDSSGATAEDAIAIGHGAASGGVSSTAIGDGTMVMPGAVNSTAIGTASSIQGTSTNAYSLGTKNSIGASNVAVVGNNNTITPSASNTMVLGNNITATKPNSVILGEGSTDGAYKQITSVTIPNIADGMSIVYDGFNGTATGVVSIGSKGKERQLTNVAPGEISATSTDTINGSQLYAVAYKLGEQVSNTYFHTNLNDPNQGAGDPATNKGRILDKAGATGEFSVTAGVNAFANGVGATAIGHGAKAYWNQGIALGQNATIRDNSNSVEAHGAIAIGGDSNTQGKGGIAIGRGATSGSEQVQNPKGPSHNEYAIAIGDNATSKGENSIAIGRDANITKSSGLSVAVGSGSTITATEAVAIGSGANAQQQHASSLGRLASATAISSTAIGANAKGLGIGASAFGALSSASGRSSTAVGHNAQATAHYATSLGRQANATAENALALGEHTQATAKNAIAIGSSNKTVNTAVAADDRAYYREISVTNRTEATAENAIAIGYLSQAKGRNSIAVGVGHTVEADNAGAFGDPSHLTAEAIGSYAVGNNNTITSANTFVLGSGIGRSSTDLAVDSGEGTVANSVYLGNESEVTRGTGSVGGDGVGSLKTWDKDQQSGATATTAGANGTVSTAKVGPLTYGSYTDVKSFAGATSTGAVSVGSSGAERRIQNVAAGEISKTSTDAINGSQLYAVAHQASKPITFKANSNKDTLNATMPFAAENGLERILGDEINIKGAISTRDLSRNSDAATAGTYSARNVQTVVDDQGVQIQIATNPIFDSVQFVSSSGPKITNDGGTNIKVAKADGSATRITNVANGTEPNDAVNLSQLNATRVSVVAGNNTYVTERSSADGKTYKIDAEKTVVTTGTGLTVTTSGGDSANNVTTYNVALDQATQDQLAKEETVSTGTPDLVTVTTNATKNSTGGNDFVVNVTKGEFAPVSSTGALAAPTTDGVATVADVVTAVNSGFFTVNADGAKAADIKFGDTLNFANGTGTTAVVKDGGVAYNTNVDGTTIQIDQATNSLKVNTDALPKTVVAAGNNTNVASKTEGSTTTYTIDAEKTVVTTGTGLTVTPSDSGNNVTTYNVALDQATQDQLAKEETVSTGTPDLVTVTTNATKNSTGGNDFVVNVTKGEFAPVSSTGALAAPTTDGVATVADVVTAVNSGFFTVNADGAKAADIKFGDTLNFANGTGTTAVVKDGGVAYNTNVDGTTIQIDQATNSLKVNTDALPKTVVAAGNNTNVASKTEGSTTTYTIDAEKTVVTTGTGLTVSSSDAGNNVTTYNVELDQATKDQIAKEETVSTGTPALVTVTTNATKNSTGGNDFVVNVTKGTFNGATTEGALNTAGTTDGVATVNDVIAAVNASGFNVTTGGNEADGNEAGATLINPGEEITYSAGKNLTVKREGNVFTYATADDVTFNNVTASNLSVGPVNITSAGINAGNTVITNVASGGDTDTNGANIGDIKRIAAKSVEKVVLDDTVTDNIATVNTESGEAAGEAGETYKVGVSKQAVKDAAKEAINVTGTAPISVAKTDENGVDTYTVSFDGTKAAESIPLTYKANGAGAQTVNLSEGLNFTNGDKTVATVGADGVVTFDLSDEAKAQLAKEETVIAGDSGLVTVTSPNKNDTGGKEFIVEVRKGEFNTATNPTGSIAAPTTDGVATTNDVVNAINKGYWTAQVGGNELKQVHFGDVLNFVNGNGTKAVNKEGAVAYDVNLVSSDNTITLAPGTDGAVDIKVNTTNLPKTVVEAGTGPVAVTGTGTAADPYKVSVNTTTVMPSPAQDLNGSVASVTDPSAVMTAGDVITTIKNAGFKLTASANGGAETGSTVDSEVINPGDTVDMAAGKNLVVKQEANGKITYATADDVTFNNATVSNLTATGDTVVNNFTVKPGATIDMGNNVITNVASGGDTDTNGANIGDIKRIAAKSVEKVILDETVTDNIATVNTESGDAAGNAGETYKVGVSKQAVQTAAKEAINVTGTAPISVAKTDEDGVDTYTVTFDGTKAAESIPLTYKANGANTQTVMLSQGLNFTNGDKTVATVGADGKVSFDLSDEAKTQLAKEETVIAGDSGLVTVDDTAVNSTGGKEFKVDITKGEFAPVSSIGALTAPTTDGVATVSDIVTAVNSGYWTATVNGDTKVSDVKFGDSLNFVNGTGTTAAVKDGGVTFNVNVDDDTIKIVDGNITVNTDALPKTKLVDGKNTTVEGTGTEADPYKVNVEGNLANITSISNGDTTIKLGDATVNVGGATITNVANGTKPGDAVNYEQLQASKEEVVSTDKSVSITEGKTEAGAKKFDLSVNTDGTTIIKNANGALTVATTPLTNTAAGAVNVPVGTEASKLATAGDIANAINNSGFTVKANAETTGELINPGESVTFKEGKNINIIREGSVFTVKTVDTPVFTSVQFNENGPIIKADASNNINIAKADGSATKITNVASGTDDTDAVNVKQLKDTIASSKTVIQAGDNVNITGDGSKDKPYVINAKDTTATASVKDGSSEFLTVTANGTVTASGTSTTDYAVGLTDKAKNVLSNAIIDATDTDTVDFTITDNVLTANVKAVDGKGTTVNITDKGLTFDIKTDGKTITVGDDGNLTVNVDALPSTTELADGKNTTVTGTGSAADPYRVNVEGDLKDISSISNGDTSIKLGDATVNVGGATISNVKAGEKDGDAVNVSQLNETNQGWTITTSGNTDSKGVSSQVKLGKSAKPAEKTVTISGGKNIKVKQEGNTVSVATSDTPTFESVTVGGEKGVTVTSTTAKDGVKELSVGQPKAETRITNVAPGVKDTDAVNVSQLKQVQGNINAVNRKVDKLDKRVRGIGASSAAASSLPQVYIPGKSMVAAAAGGYDGASAVAVGYSRASDNGKLILKLQGTANSQGHVSGGVGVGYQW